MVETPREGTPELAGTLAIDRDACMGSGNCVFWSPDVFQLDDDGIAVVCGSIAGHEERVRIAMTNCPTSAIQMVRD